LLNLQGTQAVEKSPLSTLLRRIWQHIGPRRRRQMFLLFGLMIIASLAEVVSIGAVLPFIALLTTPEQVSSNSSAQYVMQILGLQTPQDLLLPMTVFFAVAVFLSVLMRLMLLWTQTRLGYAIGAELSLSMYQKTLYQPYAVHIARNSSEIISGISNKSKALTGSALLPVMTIMSSLMLLTSVLLTLLYIEPFLTLVAFASFGSIYLLLIRLTQNRLLTDGRRVSEGATALIKLLQESLGGIRDVLIDGTQAIHVRRFKQLDLPIRTALANMQVISSSPRYGVEGFGTIILAILAYYLLTQSNGGTGELPMLGALAIGAQRILPMLQQVYSNWAVIRGGQAFVSDALDLLDQSLPMENKGSVEHEKEIVFRNVSFRYNLGSPQILDSLNLVISKGQRVGIIGKTGSGKSTFLDLIMGLLLPTSGKILVDNVEINGINRGGWQKHIAHVPQAIFLADVSISENIALGIPKEAIDVERVRYVAQIAQIDEFIETLPLSYNTRVGERGVMLSGGQRQRIGIARALYKSVDVLVLDEATSALDEQTETKLIKAINAGSLGITTIIVTHRLSTLRDCNQIIELEAGRVKRVGTYAEIVGN
jgi:ABC-type multidrug transport system fused ATPase/permease subunit